MCCLRRTRQSSHLRPDGQFIRSLRSPYHVVKDDQTGLYRISSKAFGPSSSDGKVSGDLSQLLCDDGLSATAMYPAVKEPVGAAAVSIADVLAAGAVVEHDPVKQNWYHGAILGAKGKVKNKLQQASSEIIAIDQAEAARLDALWQVQVTR